MHWTEYHAYKQWMSEWLPHILYGSDAIDQDKTAKGTPTPLHALPNATIVKAY